MPDKPQKQVADTSEDDAPAIDLTFTAQERRVAEAYIDLVRKQTKLTYRYLRDIVAERGADDGS